MNYIHPFPARMAPDIIHEKILNLRPGLKILDPMVGSGMVLRAASRYGLKSYGVDVDPLAVLIANTTSTRINENDALEAMATLLETAVSLKSGEVFLPWIDCDEETSSFISFWFDKQQIEQLRRLSYCLIEKPIGISDSIRNVLLISISRLIVTKEPKASLARDTAHSRPHRVIAHSVFNVFRELPKSLNFILSALRPETIIQDSKTFLGDARNLSLFKDNEFDSIITSPPYLNALDYLRGHKLSLVWFGYTVSDLRSIRSNAIGAAKAITKERGHEYSSIISEYNYSDHEKKTELIIHRYIADLADQINECYRVLKRNCEATFVIGNCEVKGKQIKNDQILKRIAKNAGFVIVSEIEREIPNNKRYMPMSTKRSNSISRRLHTEHVITFAK